ncbi:MAG TPA: hypothetical protein VD932_02495 [Aquabacterium sp.]|nr:hypothetical protein [Aquabacterium sp.]
MDTNGQLRAPADRLTSALDALEAIASNVASTDHDRIEAARSLLDWQRSRENMDLMQEQLREGLDDLSNRMTAMEAALEAPEDEEPWRGA